MNRPMKIVNSSSGIIVFDGLEAVVWKILMSSNVVASGVTVKNVSPGQLYTFIFVQDAVGGHIFAWPAQVDNGALVDPQPNTTTVQNYIGNTGGILQSNAPGAWL